jgi:hypothetical protein
MTVPDAPNPTLRVLAGAMLPDADTDSETVPDDAVTGRVFVVAFALAGPIASYAIVPVAISATSSPL